MCIHKKYWSSLVDIEVVGKFFDLGKTDYGKSGIFHAWFPAPKKVLFCDW